MREYERNSRETGEGTKKRISKQELLRQLITAAVIAGLALLLLNVLSLGRDGRRQVVDQDGSEEYLASDSEIRQEEEKRLAAILSQMKGVGEVEVMITWQEPETVSVFSSQQSAEKKKVKGVMIAAEGASQAVIRDKIISAVAAVFDLPQANVMVFEKESGGNKQ